MRIRVESKSATEFEVTVEEGRRKTTHLVTVPEAYAKNLTGGTGTTAALVEESFRFLLEREAKEQILRRFELRVIGQYFPEYEREIGKRLASKP